MLSLSGGYVQIGEVW